MTDTLLTTTQAAARLGVSHVTINKWIDQGRFPNAFKLSGEGKSPYRIPESDVEDFDRKRKSEQQSSA